MKLKEGEKHDDPAIKSDSINDTIHKVKTLTPYSFKIGFHLNLDGILLWLISRRSKTTNLLILLLKPKISLEKRLRDSLSLGTLLTLKFT